VGNVFLVPEQVAFRGVFQAGFEVDSDGTTLFDILKYEGAQCLTTENLLEANGNV
jgi:hypothetical protein